METKKISVRLPDDLIGFLDCEAAKCRGSNRSLELEKAVRQRQISKLPKDQRDKIFAAMIRAREPGTGGAREPGTGGAREPGTGGEEPIDAGQEQFDLLK